MIECEVEYRVLTKLRRERVHGCESAVYVRQEHDGCRDRTGDVDAELNHLDPDHRFHAAEVREDDHGDADDDDRYDDDQFRVCRRLERSVDGCEHDRRQQQPDAVGDVPHDDEQRRGDHFDLAAETLIEELVNGEQLAAKVRRDEKNRDNDSSEEIAEDELQKAEVAAARERDAGNGNKRDGRGFSGDDGKRHGPPGYGTIAQKIVSGGLLFPAEPGAE